MNRAVDVAGAAIGLAVASPFLGAAALAIKLDDGGPCSTGSGGWGRTGASSSC